LLPHWHEPPVQTSVAEGSHVVHDAPPVPHVIGEGVVHFPDAQQPFGHDVESHTQPLPEHRCPVTQAAPPLHVHSPPVQLSPVVPQAVHPPPFTPHAVVDCSWQTLFEQQPFGHDAAVHWQLFPTHSSPEPHGSPPLHVHAPDVEHPSAVFPHGWHPAPAAAHVFTDSIVQLLPEQQPLGHVVGLQFAQAPALQSWPTHVAHMLPPVPHFIGVLPGSHVAPSQHPLHDWVSQMHAPPLQR
jgi:hypothetical protein